MSDGQTDGRIDVLTDRQHCCADARYLLSELKCHWQVRGESAEEMLRQLLIESDRIKEIVRDAELKARSCLEAKSQVQCAFSQL